MSKTKQTGLERIEAALQILYEEGLEHIKPEYQKGFPRFRAIGLAISSVTDSARNVLDLAYSALENHNGHDICAVIGWIYPLYNQTFHKSDLDRLSRMINKNGVTVNTEWLSVEGGYIQKKYNVRLVFEEVKDESE